MSAVTARRAQLAAVAAVLTAAALPAAAQSGPFPNRPVKLVVPFPAGGCTF